MIQQTVSPVSSINVEPTLTDAIRTHSAAPPTAALENSIKPEFALPTAALEDSIEPESTRATASLGDSAETHSGPTLHFRASIALGPHLINSQVMSYDAWSNVMQIGIAGFLSNDSGRYLYGVNILGNSGWVSRFNSVNDPNSVAVSPVGMRNSTSLDFLLFFGVRGSYIGFEAGAGFETSWMKWQNTVQQANSGSRVVPKVRFALTFTVTKSTDIFLAISQTINSYANLKCSNNTFNCFNDAGYVSTTELTVGVSQYFK